MKLQLTFMDMVFLKAILDRTPFTNTSVAKIIYTKYKDAMDSLVNSRNALIASYEKEVEVDEKTADGKDVKVKKKQVPEEGRGELNEKINEITTEIDFDGMLYPPIKLAVHNFPNVVVDENSGVKGLKGEGDIVAYENLKEKFE